MARNAVRWPATANDGEKSSATSVAGDTSDRRRGPAARAPGPPSITGMVQLYNKEVNSLHAIYYGRQSADSVR